MLPPESRLPEVPGLVEQEAYFVVHAPRQTGKTTALQALAQHLMVQGRYAALHFSCEQARTFTEDVAATEQAVWGAIELAAQHNLPEPLRPPAQEQAAKGLFLHVQLSRWASTCPRPLVLMFDEIDALAGPGLLSVLSQLRASYNARPAPAPWSVILCGMRDVRDYKIASGGDPSQRSSSSPFNVKLESLRLGDFSQEEVRELYAQHTAATGQVFTEQALACAWELTQGQPWLVNALAREVVEKMAVPASEPVTADHIDAAKERLILARATHLDSLVDRLQEPRIRRLLEPMLAGTYESDAGTYEDDLQYARDLGLVAPTNPLRVANPIYHEVVARVLASGTESKLRAEPKSFVLPDGRLDFDRVLREFADFWRQHGDVLATGVSYHEVAPQLVFMAFLQRVINGGGYVDREYGVGLGRMDLLVRWPYQEQGQRRLQRHAVELKVWRKRQADPLAEGLQQLDAYLARVGLEEGVLLIFDRRPRAKDIVTRTRFEQARTPSGRQVVVLRA
jgi:hypothetical protein